MRADEKVAVLTALQKTVKKQLDEARAEGDAEMREAYEKLGVTKKDLRLGGVKVGTYQMANTAEVLEVTSLEELEDFALSYGMATYDNQIKTECLYEVINDLCRDRPEVIQTRVVLAKGWEKRIKNVGGVPMFEDSDLIVPGVKFTKPENAQAKVYGCKPEDVVPIVRQLGGVEALLLGAGDDEEGDRADPLIAVNQQEQTDNQPTETEIDMKYLNLDNVEENSFDKIEAGGYVAVITEVLDEPQAEHLLVTFDIKEGPRAGYYNNDWGKKYKNAHTFMRSYTQKALGMFKAFLCRLEESNQGFSLKEWQKQSDECQLVGLEVGIVLQHKFITNEKGEDKDFMEVVRLYASNDIRNGNFTVPEPVDKRTTLPASGQQDAKPAAAAYSQPVQQPAQQQPLPQQQAAYAQPQAQMPYIPGQPYAQYDPNAPMGYGQQQASSLTNPIPF